MHPLQREQRGGATQLSESRGDRLSRRVERQPHNKTQEGPVRRQVNGTRVASQTRHGETRPWANSRGTGRFGPASGQKAGEHYPCPRGSEVRPSHMRTKHLVQWTRRAPTVYQDIVRARQAFGPLVPQATQNRPEESKPCIRSRDPQAMRRVGRPGERHPEAKDLDVRAPRSSRRPGDHLTKPLFTNLGRS